MASHTSEELKPSQEPPETCKTKSRVRGCERKGLKSYLAPALQGTEGSLWAVLERSLPIRVKLCIVSID